MRVVVSPQLTRTRSLRIEFFEFASLFCDDPQQSVRSAITIILVFLNKDKELRTRRIQILMSKSAMA